MYKGGSSTTNYTKLGNQKYISECLWTTFIIMVVDVHEYRYYKKLEDCNSLHLRCWQDWVNSGSIFGWSMNRRPKFTLRSDEQFVSLVIKQEDCVNSPCSADLSVKNSFNYIKKLDKWHVTLGTGVFGEIWIYMVSDLALTFQGHSRSKITILKESP